jgi:hypothetical protein
MPTVTLRDDDSVRALTAEELIRAAFRDQESSYFISRADSGEC